MSRLSQLLRTLWRHRSKPAENRGKQTADPDACWSGFEVERPSPIRPRIPVGKTPRGLVDRAHGKVE